MIFIVILISVIVMFITAAIYIKTKKSQNVSSNNVSSNNVSSDNVSSNNVSSNDVSSNETISANDTSMTSNIAINEIQNDKKLIVCPKITSIKPSCVKGQNIEMIRKLNGCPDRYVCVDPKIKYCTDTAKLPPNCNNNQTSSEVWRSDGCLAGYVCNDLIDKPTIVDKSKNAFSDFLGKDYESVKTTLFSTFQEMGYTIMRIIKPGQLVTRDYNPSRLNINLDDTGKIKSILLG